jgi:hypothetical protein
MTPCIQPYRSKQVEAYIPRRPLAFARRLKHKTNASAREGLQAKLDARKAEKLAALRASAAQFAQLRPWL